MSEENAFMKEDIEANLQEAKQQLIEAIKNEDNSAIIARLQARVEELQIELARKQQELSEFQKKDR